MNYIDYWRSATSASVGEWSDDGGIERCVTGLPQEIFNVVLRCRLSRDTAAARIDEAIKEFRARRIPMIWHVGRTTTPEDLGSYLEQRGFPHDYDLVAMAADTSEKLWPAETSGGLTVRPCSSRSDIEAWVDCLTRSWDSPPDVGRWMRANPLFVDGRWQSPKHFSSREMYLGLLEGVPSGAVMLLSSRGVAGLQCVGTIPEAQRKGVGDALVRAALRDASAKGYGFVVVLSTTEGVPLYRKTGFKEFGKLPEHSLYFDR
jgi:GNAT superfamily N-acetyltransferase